MKLQLRLHFNIGSNAKRVACFTLLGVGIQLYIPVFAQQTTVSGVVKDAATGELMIGASVSYGNSSYGVVTNQYGFFSITLPSNLDSIKVSYVGYLPFYLASLAKTPSPVEINLSTNQLLEEVVVKAPIEEKGAGKIMISIAQIKSIPALLGESDVLKALSLTPGVATGNEGTAGLYVRGGTPDQNLILLDEAPVYNATHLGGFFSVFNPNSLKSVSLYKGAFPARFGGRLSSVIDLTMRDGNKKKFAGELGLGILNQNLTVEGPLIKNKASFIVSGRISTLGLSSLIKPKASKRGSGEYFSYRFYDLNAKFNYQMSRTDNFYISVYNGYDYFKNSEWQNTNGYREGTGTGLSWGNTTATARYSKIISDKLFGRAVLIYSNYDSNFNTDFSKYNQEKENLDKFYPNTNTNVRDYTFKLQLEHYPASWLNLKYGTDFTVHSFRPFRLLSNYEVAGELPKSSPIIGVQTDAYVETSTTFKRFQADIGLRYSLYQVQNSHFQNPEPRIGLSWSLPKNWAFKGSYSVMNQYVHLLTNNGLGLSADAWVPSTSKVPPANARQFSFGIYKSIPKSNIDISVEIYSKKLKRLIDYPDGLGFSGLVADSWDDNVEKGGIGRVKGLEVMITRKIGKLNGWVSYTLSKSERQFEAINDTKWFPMKYDRRHNISTTWNYELNKKWSLSGNFVYQTGHAVTLPIAAIQLQNQLYPQLVYGDRNNGRLPAYHRLDIGITRELLTNKGRQAKLNFGVYNAYNRANPLYYDFVTTGGLDNTPMEITTKQSSLFPFLPYISYILKF